MSANADEKLVIDVVLTSRDLVRECFAVFFRSLPFKIFAALSVLAGSYCTYYYYIASPLAGSVVSSLAVLALFILCWVALMSLSIFIVAQIAYQRMKLELKSRFIFSSAGYQISNEAYFNFVRWDDLFAVIETHESFHFFVINIIPDFIFMIAPVPGRFFHIVPKRYFNAGDEQRLRALIKSEMGKKADLKKIN